MKMTGRVWWGVLLIVLGFLFVLDEHSTFHISMVFFSLWPLALMGVGVYVIMRARRPVDESFMRTAPLADIGIGQRIEETQASNVRMGNIFGDVRSRVQSRVFTGGSLSTVFGMAVVDLTAAALAPGAHSLKLDSIIGSVQVRLPKGMEYEMTADGVIGTVRTAVGARNGFFPSLQFSSVGYREAAHKIHLDLSTVIGEVRVDVVEV